MCVRGSSVLQYVALCCSGLQRVAVGYVQWVVVWVDGEKEVLKVCVWEVSMCCSVLQCVAVCCSVLQCVAVGCSGLQCVAVGYSKLQCGLMERKKCSRYMYDRMQWVAVCCSVLQWATVDCSVG